jgi:predicted amidohydrolase
MKIALAQFNPTVGDFAGNTARILALATKAKDRERTLLFFPSFVCAVTCLKTCWNGLPLLNETKEN